MVLKQARDIRTYGEVEAHAKPRVPCRRECRAARWVEEEVPGNVGSPANGQERGPSPGAEDGRTAKERGADELQAEVGRWSPTLQAEHNVVDGGYAEPYTVHEPLAAPRKPSHQHQPDRPEDANEDCDIHDFLPSSFDGVPAEYFKSF